MLKKWLKKTRRRKGSKKNGDSAGKTDEHHDANGTSRAKSSSRHGKQSLVGMKKSKPRSPSRKAQYSSIEKEVSLHSSSPQSSFRSSIGQSSLRSSIEHSSLRSSIDDISPVPSYRNAPSSPSQFSLPKLHKKEDVKKEVPLVRIRPIERPKERSPSRGPLVLEQPVDVPPPIAIPIPPPASISALTKADPPAPVLRPASPPLQIPFLAETAPSPPRADYPTLARELSYLGVASPPSIDTALFAYEEAGKEGKDDHPSEEKSLIADDSSPPTLIEAVLPLKQSSLKQTPTKPPPAKQAPAKQAPVKQAPLKQTTEEQASLECESESLASVKSKSEILQEMATAKPFQRSGEFFTATRSQSGSGSTKLQSWIDEVRRSIDAHKNQTVAGFDRYHIGSGSVTEEKPEKDESVTSGWTSNGEEVLARSRNMIDQALKETIEKSRANMTNTPRGILKSKVVESGTIRSWDGAHTEDEDEEEEEEEYDEEEYEGDEDEENEDNTVLSDASSAEPVPIKVFSSSRRQSLMEETEDETTSVESQSSSSDEVYETLRELKPSVSWDDTQASQSSVRNFFYSKLCSMVSFEEELCQADDVISLVDDDTMVSGSIVSKDSSSLEQRRGWLCFDVSDAF